MGQVGWAQGIYQLLLHTTMVWAATGMFARSTRHYIGWAWLWLPAATFAAAFAAHIVAFIVLKALLGEDIDPWVHRPVVALVWGIASGIVFYLFTRPMVRPAAIATVLTALGYLIFVLTRQLV